jgi:hypothetical protein
MGTLGKVTPTMILLFTLFVSTATQAIPDYKPPSCINAPPYDTVPYKAERFVRVAPDVKLELLDWGGSGEVMVLLTGSGDNAHVFDYFAFQFTNFFHVIAITAADGCHRASQKMVTMSRLGQPTISRSSTPWVSSRQCSSDIQ